MKRRGQVGDRSQHERFIETARALGCNEDEGAFRDVLRKVAQHKSKDRVKPPQPSPPKRAKATDNG